MAYDRNPFVFFLFHLPRDVDFGMCLSLHGTVVSCWLLFFNRTGPTNLCVPKESFEQIPAPLSTL